jgi:hypothetical protein
VARVAQGAQQQVPSRALPAGCQQPLKRQPAARGWPNKGISVAYGLGWVPPERIGFRDTLILAFPEPQRPSRSAGSAALRSHFAPHRVLAVSIFCSSQKMRTPFQLTLLFVMGHPEL